MSNLSSGKGKIHFKFSRVHPTIHYKMGASMDSHILLLKGGYNKALTTAALAMVSPVKCHSFILLGI